MADRYYPIFLDIAGAPCLVVGGGRIAERKVKSLRQCGARVIVVSPEVTPGLAAASAAGEIEIVPERYSSTHAEGKKLIIAATSDRSVNEQVYSDAQRAGVPVNTVDVPDLCTFIVPAIYRQGDIRVAVSTGGGAPGLAGRIRDRVGAVVGPEWGVFVASLKGRRDRIRVLPDANKEALWKHVREFDITELHDRLDEIEALVELWVTEHEKCAAGHPKEMQ